MSRIEQLQFGAPYLAILWPDVGGRMRASQTILSWLSASGWAATMVNHVEQELEQVNFPVVWAPTSDKGRQIWGTLKGRDARRV